MALRPVLAVAFAAVSTFAAVGPALAQQAESRTVQVRVADLDLSTPNGVARMNGRVGQAVSSVCGTTVGQDLPMRAGIKTCRSAAFAMAKPQMDRLIAGAQGTQLAMIQIR